MVGRSSLRTLPFGKYLSLTEQETVPAVNNVKSII